MPSPAEGTGFASRLAEARRNRIVVPPAIRDEGDRFIYVMQEVNRKFEEILKTGMITRPVTLTVSVRQGAEDPSVGWFSREFSPELRQKLTLALAKLDAIIDSIKSVGGNVRRWEIKMHVVEDA